jgi:hypothetical protein
MRAVVGLIENAEMFVSLLVHCIEECCPLVPRRNEPWATASSGNRCPHHVEPAGIRVDGKHRDVIGNYIADVSESSRGFHRN